MEIGGLPISETKMTSRRATPGVGQKLFKACGRRLGKSWVTEMSGLKSRVKKSKRRTGGRMFFLFTSTDWAEYTDGGSLLPLVFCLVFVFVLYLVYLASPLDILCIHTTIPPPSFSSSLPASKKKKKKTWLATTTGCHKLYTLHTYVHTYIHTYIH